jgi:hypothetical protein
MNNEINIEEHNNKPVLFIHDEEDYLSIRKIDDKIKFRAYGSTGNYDQQYEIDIKDISKIIDFLKQILEESLSFKQKD